MKRRVVISGIGVVAPTGGTTEEFFEGCRMDRAAVAPIPNHWHSYFEPVSKLWAPLAAWSEQNDLVTRIERMQFDRATRLALACTLQALQTANISRHLRDERKNTWVIEGIDGARCGVFIGTGMAGITSFAANEAHHLLMAVSTGIPELRTKAALLRTPPRFNPFSVSMSMPNASAASIAIKLGLTGTNRTICHACASGAFAVGEAFHAIRSGSLDMAISGGTEYLDDDYGGTFRGFDSAKTLVRKCETPERANRPFDRNRSGFLFAEGGAAVLVLEEAGQAIHRGVTPIAEIIGFGESFDAHSLMAVEPSGQRLTESIVAALNDADVSPSNVDYVNAHGTGTELNDDVETAVMDRIYGRRPAINTTKSLIGHTVGAAGAIEAAVTALSLREQWVHGCRNLEDPILPLNFVCTSREVEMEMAVSHSFGFGGHNAVLVLRRFSE